MADEKALRHWVEDNLHALLGLSERALVDYCISLAKRTPDASRLASSLESQGLPASSETRRFAQDLLSRLPGAAAGNNKSASAYRQHERAAAELARKNQSYGLLVDDDEQEEEQKKVAPTPARQQQHLEKNGGGGSGSKAAEKKHLRRSRKHDDSDDNQDKDKGGVRKKSRKRAWQEEEEDGEKDGKPTTDEGRAAEDRQRDLEEKAEFERRLKERDDAKTKKLAERKISKTELEEITRRQKAEKAENRNLVVTDLRKFSRQEYLKKREEAKIEDLEAEIEEEERLFAGMALTKKEQADLEYKKEVLRLAKEKKKHLDELERDEAYHMPQAYDDEHGQKGSSKRYEVLTARYREADEENAAAAEAPWAQQEAFEAEQIKKASIKVGAKDKHIRNKGKEQAYDFVFEDQIDFIVDAYLAGDRPEEDVAEESKEERLIREREERDAEKRSEFDKIQEGRRNLPMFPYREELLKAIEEHQILIIVGETGSGKTTQIPQYLFEAGYGNHGKIGCTQPRRVAAMSVAARVAQEMGVKLGNEVGYSIRFEDCTSDKNIGQIHD
ncbi:hypothetical protein Ndes2526B_g01575 [Nannochloris sp. 'desiccata']